MTVSYLYGENPIWYFTDAYGNPLSGGYLATLSNLDQVTQNPVYEDPAGLLPWPYVNIPNTSGKTGILFDANGQQGPFYFKFDSSNPTLIYYLEVYDQNGNLQWTIPNYNPASAGGGGTTTEGLNIKNLIVNNVMYRNFGASTNPISTNNILVAPGCHSGLTNTNPTGGNAGSDIVFYKNNTSATDILQFNNFLLNQSSTFGPNDTTPAQYLNYTCTVAGTGESYKYVQFPITSKVQTLTNVSVVVTIWAQSTLENTLTLQWRQFFGDGPGATADVVTVIANQVLTSSWTKYTFTVTIPNVSSATLGGCGNDGLFLQIQYPLNSTCNINFTKPCVYLGNLAPTYSYDLHDQIDGTLNVPRCGMVDVLYDLYATPTFAPPGWIFLNDGTIGSPSSTASAIRSTEAFPLYNLLWTNVSAPSSNARCPVTGGLGSSAVADFLANKPLQLPQHLGRVFATLGQPSSGFNTGNTWPIAYNTGNELVTIAVGNLPDHTHVLSTQPAPSTNNQNGGTNQGVSRYVNTNTGGITGGTANTPINIQPPTVYMHAIIKL